MKIHTMSHRRSGIVCVLGLGALVGVTGCQGLSGTATSTASSAVTHLTGRMMGGEQPVVGATLQLYYAGTGGDGTGASGLLNPTATTDQNGGFNISNEYRCPASKPEVYLVATGGNPGQSTSNPNIALMAALGPCNTVAASNYPSIFVDEVTTVASIAALYPYMSTTNTPSTENSYASLASGSSDAAALTTAFNTVAEYTNISSGTAPGPALPSGYYASSNEVDSLADIVANCVDSTGGLSGSNTACGNLFRLATPSSGVAPTDTIGAIINILDNPTQSVGPIFLLLRGQGPFQPTDAVAPPSWALPILQVPSAPTFSVPTGTYSSSQTLTISDSLSGAAIYYTTNGSTPTTASNLYSGPIPISATETVTAVAVNGGTAYSPTTSATYTLPMDFTLSASPQTVQLVAGGTVTFDVLAKPINLFSGTVTVTASTPGDGVTLNASSYSLTPGVPTLIQITAPSNVYTTQQITLTGTSGSLSHSMVVELSGGTKPDYYLTTSAAAVSLVAGSSQTLQLEANALNGFTSSVTAQVTGLPAGVTASPSSYTLTPGTAQSVTFTAGSGVAAGNTLVTFTSTATGSLSHNTPVMLNFGAQTQDFVLATPASVNVSPSGTATMVVMASAIGGFSGNVTASISGLPTGVSANPSSVTLKVVPQVITTFVPTATNVGTVTLTGLSSLGSGNVSFTVTGTAMVGTTTLTHQNTIQLTESPGSTVGATVCTSGNTSSSCQGVTLAGNSGTAFPAHYVGFSFPSNTLQEFTGTGSTPYASFISLLSTLYPYVGTPSIRTQLPGTTAQLSQLAALNTAAAYTSNSVTTYPQYFLTTNQAYSPLTTTQYVTGSINAVGSSNVLGFELDNEPEFYPLNGYRASGWTYSDYLAETTGYQQTFASSIATPQLIATAEALNYWDVGIPALLTQESGQLSTFTAHQYALSACSSPSPTIAQLLADSSAHYYYARYAGLVQTLGSVPVRVGEMNSLSCTGLSGVSNAFAASLWVVDAAFEAKLAGAAGFNIQSGGTASAGADAYDIGFETPGTNNTGQLSVYAPFYGVLFFAQAIQNGAKPLPVTITQSSGNVKVWATIDASNTVRVVVLEKDTDGVTNSKSVTLNLGTAYTKAATQITMSAGSVSATSGFNIGGQTINANGVVTPSTPTTTSVTGTGGVYTITVNDGTANILTVPM